MGTKRPTNEGIRIGSIFQHSATDECGSSCSLYQVVGKRGKTLVELRAIRGEDFVDENCDLGRGQVRVRPLPGQFFPNAEIITVGACTPSEIDGRNWLHGRGEDSWMYYSELRDGETGYLSGYDGFYVIDALKKEGKLPS